MGPHIVDLPVWALELGAPKSVTACGGRYATTDVSTIPDTVHVAWDYGDLMMTWTNQCANSHGLQFHGGKGITRRLGVSFHGVDGTCTADYNRREVIAEGERLDESQLPEPSLPASPGHDREFLNSVKSRELPSCDVDYQYRVHLALNLGNLSMQLGRTLHWDAEKEQIIGDEEANAMLVPNYRAPWVLPA
jgi:predicted dehydrogenase